MEYELPSWLELFKLAPLSVLVLSIAGIGWFVGWRSRGESVQAYKEWKDSLEKKG